MLMMNEAYYTVDSHAEFLICNHGDFWIRGTIRRIRLHFLKSGYKANQDEEKKHLECLFLITLKFAINCIGILT